MPPCVKAGSHIEFDSVDPLLLLTNVACSMDFEERRQHSKKMCEGYYYMYWIGMGVSSLYTDVHVCVR